jgi:hypothetical protein
MLAQGVALVQHIEADEKHHRRRHGLNQKTLLLTKTLESSPCLMYNSSSRSSSSMLAHWTRRTERVATLLTVSRELTATSAAAELSAPAF